MEQSGPISTSSGLSEHLKVNMILKYKRLINNLGTRYFAVFNRNFGITFRASASKAFKTKIETIPKGCLNFLYRR